MHGPLVRQFPMPGAVQVLVQFRPGCRARFVENSPQLRAEVLIRVPVVGKYVHGHRLGLFKDFAQSGADERPKCL
jgi:hypothetical protein